MSDSNKNFGGRELDWLLCQKLASDFEEEHDQNPMDNPKSTLTLLAEAEKVRKALSGDLEAQISIDSLVDDIEFEYELTR